MRLGKQFNFYNKIREILNFWDQTGGGFSVLFAVIIIRKGGILLFTPKLRVRHEGF